MKLMRNILILCFLALSFLCDLPASAQSKHALIFAVGNYPEENGWTTLSSLYDTVAIRTSLIRQGFPEKNIKVYKDAEVYPASMISAFESLLSSKDVKAGGIIVVHVSSHGEQVEDNNGDEIDRLDECIVTYHALSPRKAQKKDFEKNQKEYFRDDQFGMYITRLREKLGKNGHVLVFIDACHSGSGTRGDAKVRGNQPPLLSEKFDTTDTKAVDIKGVFRDSTASKKPEKELANYVVISAARAEELDHEVRGKNMGSLSYCISKAFEQLAPGTTYRALFAKIQSVMSEVSPDQHPVLEGNGVDNVLFGPGLVSQKPYFSIQRIVSNKLRAVVNAGLLSGLDVGAVVEIHKSGTANPSPATLLATGKVIEAYNFYCVISLDKNPGITPINGWAFVTEPVYNSATIRLKLSAAPNTQSGFTTSEEANIKAKMAGLKLISFEGDPELNIIKGEVRDSIRIRIASNGYLFSSILYNDSFIEKLKNEIEHYSRYKFLRDVKINDPHAQVEIRLIPFINKKADESKWESKYVQGIYEYKVGESFVIWVKNKGERPVYLNILDLSPNGAIGPIFPNRHTVNTNGVEEPVLPSDLKIAGNATRLFSKWPITLGPPLGDEIFKIFVSEKEIDMEDIADTLQVTSRGSFTILSKLVKESNKVASRGEPSPQNYSTKDGTTFNLVFRIMEADKKKNK